MIKNKSSECCLDGSSRPKAALLFLIFSDFICGVLLVIDILVIY